MSPKKPALVPSTIEIPSIKSGRITRSRKKEPPGNPISSTASADISTPSPGPDSVDGDPPAWAESRPELCDSLPWFRAVQGGVYHNGNLCLGFLVDADCGVRSFIDDEIVITRVGGGCTKDADGNLVLLKDQDNDSSAISSLVNSMGLKVPVGMVIGDRNALLRRKLPHRYNVMAYFRVTHIWYERMGKKAGAKVRFEKVDLSDKSWWTVKDAPPPRPIHERRFDVQAKSLQCSACHQWSVQVYKQGWMCLHPSCKKFWSIHNSPPPLDLTFHADFLRARLPPDPEVQPHYSLVPDLLSTLTEDNGDAISKRIAWKGIVCPWCSKCISRRFWQGWRCSEKNNLPTLSPGNESHRCRFEKMMRMQPVSLRSVIEDLELSPIKRALNFSPKFMTPEIDDRSLHPYRKLVYIIPGVGSITHLVSCKSINTRIGGPDDLFKQLQLADLGLQRYPLQQSVVAGTLTAHFAVNYGMPYKYVVSVESKGFDEACSEIIRALGRLTWATSQAVKGTGDRFIPPNELLLLGYLEGMKIGYHDDGESSLGPTVATLSLGAKSTMLVRMKHTYYHGVSKGKKLLLEDPILPGCNQHDERKALKDQLANGSLSQEKYDNLRTEVTKKSRGREAPPCIKMELNHGDLVVMHGERLQKYYEHSVIPEKNLRFALTARYIKPDHVSPKELRKGQFTLAADQIYDGK
ncbi:hypothetical protein BO70DRAFT_406448 [Aspergillus heteromorphus CBS 117.55]|uniref:Fe2OG dioxygenase domain-containing protein n=1 Tax=Aspergillus heteromorphus CBS 117.55 TaxID=1448321 RepID=A0A317W1P2_9EURO|nr:uncharacterized protein BO70DRAFT_406448 [Aspergillus heteromorphus CBS 117.55]PWY80494.1 hypothetical protein BO70DRAFT_406448 [Aspergillus heteromorphus CBS 117.55]